MESDEDADGESRPVPVLVEDRDEVDESVSLGLDDTETDTDREFIGVEVSRNDDEETSDVLGVVEPAGETEFSEVDDRDTVDDILDVEDTVEDTLVDDDALADIDAAVDPETIFVSDLYADRVDDALAGTVAETKLVDDGLRDAVEHDEGAEDGDILDAVAHAEVDGDDVTDAERDARAVEVVDSEEDTVAD